MKGGVCIYMHIYTYTHLHISLGNRPSVDTLGSTSPRKTWWTTNLDHRNSLFHLLKWITKMKNNFIKEFKNLTGFCGGSVVKNLPANAEGMGLIPGLRRSHVLPSSHAQAPQLLSLCSGAQVLQLLSPWAATAEPNALEPVFCNRRSHCNEKSMHHNEG